MAKKPCLPSGYLWSAFAKYSTSTKYFSYSKYSGCDKLSGRVVKPLTRYNKIYSTDIGTCGAKTCASIFPNIFIKFILCQKRPLSKLPRLPASQSSHSSSSQWCLVHKNTNTKIQKYHYHKTAQRVQSNINGNQALLQSTHKSFPPQI